MQINTDEIKKIKKLLSFNNTNASLPMICAKVVFPSAVGGVEGKKKAITPNNAAAAIAI